MKNRLWTKGEERAVNVAYQRRLQTKTLCHWFSNPVGPVRHVVNYYILVGVREDRGKNPVSVPQALQDFNTDRRHEEIFRKSLYHPACSKPTTRLPKKVGEEVVELLSKPPNGRRPLDLTKVPSDRHHRLYCWSTVRCHRIEDLGAANCRWGI